MEKKLDDAYDDPLVGCIRTYCNEDKDMESRYNVKVFLVTGYSEENDAFFHSVPSENRNIYPIFRRFLNLSIRIVPKYQYIFCALLLALLKLMTLPFFGRTLHRVLIS